MRSVILGLAVSFSVLATPALAARCGNTSAGFESWKSEFAAEAKANGVNAKAISALMGTKYANATIKADRNQKSFKYSLAKFWQVRGADTIISQGKRQKSANAALFDWRRPIRCQCASGISSASPAILVTASWT